MSKVFKPLISIIIPTYNCESTIINTLQSIVGQSYKNIEVLVLDNLSTDGTTALVGSFITNSPNITLYSEKDKGVYDAMNKGIQLAKGDFLYFMGGDDVFYDCKTVEQVFETVTPEQDFIYGNVLFKNSQEVYSGASNLQKLVYDRISICHQAIFYSKRVFKIVGLYNLKYFIHADHDFNIRCFKNNALNISYIGQIIAIFNENGISGSQSTVDDGYSKTLLEENLRENYTLVELFQENKKLKLEKELLKKSWSFRIGRFVLGPLRFIRRFIK